MIDIANIERFSANNLKESLADSPAILIHGSRQTGKTTLARMVCEPMGYAYITFDDDNQRQAAQTDPVGFVRTLPEKIILDEIQRVPELFTAIKVDIDQNRKSGRFVLTGSANVMMLPALADSLAGRIGIIHLRPFAQCEIASQVPDLIDRFFNNGLEALAKIAYTPLEEGLSAMICKGGYPAAVARASAKRRSIWYRDYIQTILQRDVQDIARIQNLEVLPKLLSLAASQTARLFNASDLASPFAISRPTIKDYLALLEQIFMIEQLQPWHSNRLSRLIKTPKMHLLDTGLTASLLGVSSQQLWQDKILLGQLLETFVYQELRKQADWHAELLTFYHFRNKDKVEVDIVIHEGQRLVGVEVKAAATIYPKDFHGLKKLQTAHPEHFCAGVVFYDGDHLLPFGDKLWAVPLRLLATNQPH